MKYLVINGNEITEFYDFRDAINYLNELHQLGFEFAYFDSENF